ncbi:MAG: hypothetical protein AAF098_19525 [Pseudomonadota bacterium]
MFYRCAFNIGHLSKRIQASSESKLLDSAFKKFEDDNFADGHEIIEDLVTHSHALALVLSSMYSLEDESEKQFDDRHLSQLLAASDGNEPLAHYALGVYFDTGEIVACVDKQAACEYFWRAAEGGVPQGMHVFGIMLYYGTGGAEKDESRGLSMIKSAADSGVDDAIEFLKLIGNPTGQTY